MLEIDLKTIPHSKHRYETVGDYWVTPDEKIHVRISDMKNWRYEFLVALHELVELAVCKHKGISFKDIDAFDKDYEANRQEGDVSEPGDDISAPYYAEHQLATAIERIIAQKLDVDWDAYNQAVNEL